jgi:hypothetical protein
MNTPFRVLLDRLMFGFGIAGDEKRHAAFEWLLPPETRKYGVLDAWACRFRPGKREWFSGMTSMSEQAYCEWYTSQLFTGRGEIVELGCWLGSLTRAMVHGLRRNRYSADGKKIQSYDLFSWHHSFAEALRLTQFANATFQDGDDFHHLYLESIKDVQDRVVSRKADLCSEKWNGGNIEFLVVDAMKYEALVRNIQKNFFPALMPRTGILMHQDFLHFYEGWIHVTMFKLRKFFTPLCAIPDSGTFVFRCDRRPEGDALDFPEKVSALPGELVEESFAWALSLPLADGRDKVAAAHTMMYVHRGDVESARRLFHGYCVQGPYGKSPGFIDMVNYLKEDRGIVL